MQIVSEIQSVLFLRGALRIKLHVPPIMLPSITVTEILNQLLFIKLSFLIVSLDWNVKLCQCHKMHFLTPAQRQLHSFLCIFNTKLKCYLLPYTVDSTENSLNYNSSNRAWNLVFLFVYHRILCPFRLLRLWFGIKDVEITFCPYNTVGVQKTVATVCEIWYFLFIIELFALLWVLRLWSSIKDAEAETKAQSTLDFCMWL